MKHVCIVGCGQLGRALAHLYQTEGATVSGLVRSKKSAHLLEDEGIQAVQGDLAEMVSLSPLPLKGAHVFYMAPPPRDGETDPLLRRFLALMAPDGLPQKLVLISTTAVYGDCEGEWITEERPPRPQTPRGKRRLDAERAALAWSSDTGVPVVILRVGGIYGPGRLPLARLKQGLPILKESESPFTNRIHETDLARICRAADSSGSADAIYNVSDGRPSTMSHYFKAVAEACGLPQPPEVSLAEAKEVMSAGMLSYLGESRRLDNTKLLRDLGVTLLYPDLAAGLEAIKRPQGNVGE
jgi:nucleoside-diphosphate-sugar epimerase